MKKNFPEIVCWRVTSKCNRHCPFCFRPSRSDLNTAGIYRLIDELALSGVKGIGLTGGEPLIRKDIAEIFKYIFDKKIKICLATNADFYQPHRRFINKFVTTVGLPIEGPDEEKHDFSRGEGNFRNVMNALRDIYKRGRAQIYFSTVLTQKNIKDLAAIENLLAGYRDRIIYWKIYNIIDYSDRPFQSVKSNKISGPEIKKSIGALGGRLGKDKIFYLSSNDRSEASVLINPDGEVTIPMAEKGKTKDFSVGNLLKDGVGKIFGNWGQAADSDKYRCHKCALRCVK